MSARIAVFVPSLRGGGAERVAIILAGEFTAQGIAVDLIAARAEGELRDSVPGGVRFFDLSASRVAFSLQGLVRYLRRERPRALLSLLDHANLIALLAVRLAGTRTWTVVSVRSTISASAQEAASVRGRLMPLWVRLGYGMADRVVAVSEGVASDLRRIAPRTASKIRVIYNPVLIEEVQHHAGEPSGEPWLDQPDRPVILGVGRLSRVKGFDTLIRAFADVRARRPVRLVILGEGSERLPLQRLAGELGVAHDVRMPGFRGNPFACMSKAAVFALTSIREGLPNVMIEALACGCPVVSTDCRSGPAEILEGGRWGRLVPVGDVPALSAAILETLSRPPERAALQMRARFYSARGIARSYLAELLSGR